jgi:Mlc titration factor MtfA (ptsG expression regulator)
MISYYIFPLLYSTDNTVIAVFLTALFGLMLYFGFRMVEMLYVMKKRKPLYIHFYLSKKKLSQNQLVILKNFSFYDRLKDKEQVYFEHRVANFIKDKTFIGRDGLSVSDEHKVLISATAVMLTFGFRDYFIGLIDKIFVYPKAFYSTINEEHHKGEFNPKLKALVLSWEDFLKGHIIGNDNLNVGIHEFAHAIHLNSIKERDVSSTIFKDSFKELTDLLSNDKPLRDKLIQSKYFRDYAYTNQFEFVAVLIEYFIESPQEFQSNFPRIYDKVKQMLNFNYHMH